MRPYLPAILRLIRLSSRVNLATVLREKDLISVTLDRSCTRILPSESTAVILLRFLSMPSIPLGCINGVCFEKDTQTLERVRVAERILISTCLRTLKT